jgi:hypothetical protein
MPYTKLQAINAMLTSVGESTVLTYVEGATDVANAETVLDNETLIVLGAGWDCNTDDGVELSPDADGRIAVPIDALQIDPIDPRRRVVQRNGFLWDKDRLTATFDGPIKFRIVRALPFDGLPYPLQRRIAAQAAMRYQQSYVGSPTLDKSAKEDLMAADAQAQDAESDSDDFNLFDNADIAWFRRNVRRGLV